MASLVGLGAACESAVITAMGVPSHSALGSVRLTLGRSTTERDITEASFALANSWKRLKEPG